MKKKITSALLGAFLVISFTACNKCVTCGSCPAGITLTDEEICSKDFDSKDEYDAAVAVVEAFGCTCN